MSPFGKRKVYTVGIGPLQLACCESEEYSEDSCGMEVIH